MSSFIKPAVFLLISLFFVTVCGQQLDILSSDEIFQDEILTVTCDAKRFTLPPGTKIIPFLSIVRQVGSESESIIAQYNPGALAERSKEVKKIPPGREWDITFTGGKLVNGANKDRMATVLRISDTKCDDAGIYKCLLNYVDKSFLIRKLNSVQNLVVKAPIENHLLTAVPHNGNDLLYSLYPLGSNVTLTCSIQGPPGLTMKWQEKLATDPDFTDYDVLNDTVTKDPELVLRDESESQWHTICLAFDMKKVKDGSYRVVPITDNRIIRNGSTNCTKYHYESTLNLVIEEQDQLTTSYPALYQCVVRENFVDLSKVKITLALDTHGTDSQNNKDDSTFASSTSDTGIIVGCVLGGLALITIFLGYGLKYRKKPKGSSYEEDTDSPDGTTTHSDPPVPPSQTYSQKSNEDNETSVDVGFVHSKDTVFTASSGTSNKIET